MVTLRNAASGGGLKLLKLLQILQYSSINNVNANVKLNYIFFYTLFFLPVPSARVLIFLCLKNFLA